MNKEEDLPMAAISRQLRARIAALEGVGGDAKAEAVPIGVRSVDAVLPWGGLPLGCLHEIAPRLYGDGIEDRAAAGFAAVVLGRMAARLGKPVLWVAAGDEPYAPGLAALGLPPERLLVARSIRAGQVLWAMEEGVRCRGLAAVLAEAWSLDLTGARRLQLAARASGVAALVLNRGDAAGPAVTRWRVGAAAGTALPGQGGGPWCWRVELLRCRGRGVGERGMVAAWDMEWSDEAGSLRLAAAAGDGTPAPQRIRAAG